MNTHRWIDVAVQTPAHSQVGGLLSYRSPFDVQPGQLVRVPLGQREVLGVVWDVQQVAPPDMPASAMRDVLSVLQGLAPLDAAWRQLVQFSAQYYQRSLGEVALSALPPQLRDLSSEQLARRLKKQTERVLVQASPGHALSAEQSAVLAQMQIHPQMPSETGSVSGLVTGKAPFLLFGSTGSGKTEVYLQAVQRMLQADPQAQALLMVPEINLTPQLEERVQARFGTDTVVSMHSGMTHPQRLRSWLAAHSGEARVVLGTRMAVFASMLLQFPLGRLADRWDRRKLIACIAIAASLSASIVATAGNTSLAALFAATILFMALMASLYPTCLGQMHNRLQGENPVAANAGQLLCYGLGTCIGPLICGVAMGHLGPAGLFVTVGSVLVGYAAFVAWRLRVIAETRALATGTQPSVMVMGESTTVMAQMDPRVRSEVLP